MNKWTYKIGVEAAYRRSALRFITAFRTVLTDEAVMIAVMMPLGLVVDVERKKRDMGRGIDLSNPVQLADDAME